MHIRNKFRLVDSFSLGCRDVTPTGASGLIKPCRCDFSQVSASSYTGVTWSKSRPQSYLSSWLDLGPAPHSGRDISRGSKITKEKDENIRQEDDSVVMWRTLYEEEFTEVMRSEKKEFATKFNSSESVMAVLWTHFARLNELMMLWTQ